MGFRLWAFTASSEARTRAAAPSERGEALAGVTVPFSLRKAGRRVRVFSSLNYDAMSHLKSKFCNGPDGLKHLHFSAHRLYPQ